MRRILFPLLVIGLAGGLFTLGSGAFFSDTETDTSNTITAGNLDLTKTTAFATTCAATTNAKPGDTFPCATTLTNSGSLAGDLYMEVSQTGDLAPVLTISSGDANGTGTLTGTVADDWADRANWSLLDLTCTKVAELTAGQTFTLSIPTTFSTDANDDSQGDSASLSFKYKLMQAGAANTTCE
jgi:predicted ribosomally synthesized peptide with SipW-like signal peptide